MADSKGKAPNKCRLCGNDGHLAETCPNPNAMKICNICKKKGHIARKCPTPEVNSVCGQCGRKGHTTKNCNIILWDTPKYVKCSRCNEEGHATRDCKQKPNRDENSNYYNKDRNAASTSNSLPTSSNTTPPPSTSPSPPPAAVSQPKRKDDPKIVAMEQTLHGIVRNRQIRLDYHTSEHLTSLASDFTPSAFAETFKAANVDGVTLTARCNHGFLYYHSTQHKVLVHPNLSSQCNLLVEQVKALHKNGIRAPVYVSVAWDHNSAVKNPDWLQIRPRNHSTSPSFYPLCLNTPYSDAIKSIVEELVNVLEDARAQGAGFDGIQFGMADQECSCEKCLAGVREQGGDPDNLSDRKVYGASLVSKFRREIAALTKKTFQVARFGKQLQHKKKSYSIFFGTGHVVSSDRRLFESTVSHIEVENDVPVAARYARGVDAEVVVAVNNGSFHEFKNIETLQYECSRALAYGAKNSIVDQLHPNGKLTPYTYQLVGKVYEELKNKEIWCLKAAPLVEAAVFTTEEFGIDLTPTLGATKILEGLGYQFDVIDSLAVFSRYKLLVLPDSIPVDAKFGAKLEAFLDAGGSILATGSSGFDATKSSVVLQSLGVQLIGPAECSPDFILLGDNALGHGLPKTELVVHTGAWHVKAEKFSLVKGAPAPVTTKPDKEEGDEGEDDGSEEGDKKHEGANGKAAPVAPAPTPSGPATQYNSEVLASAVAPYFNRSWDHFTSHAHTPSSGKVTGPAAVYTPQRRVVYFAHPLFSEFWNHSSVWTTTLVANALRMLLPTQIITTPGSPSTLLSTVLQQARTKFIIHLLHYVPQRVGTSNFEVVKDVIPLSDVRVELRIPEESTTENNKGGSKPGKKEEGPHTLELVPSGQAIEFERKEGGVISFVVPRVVGHQMVCLTMK